MGKRAVWLLSLWLVVGAGLAQAFEKELTYSLAPGSKLRVAMKYGQLRIVGGHDPDVKVKIHVDERSGSADDILRRLRVRYTPSGKERRLEISGLKSPHVEVVIPSETNLSASLRAGELRVQGVAGDLSANLWAGEMMLEVPDGALYKFVRAHVRIGSVGHPFGGATTGWLGNKYEAGFARGRYRLDASVGVGDLIISAPSVKTISKAM